jgi:5'-methylthioadenosine phosphorylase
MVYYITMPESESPVIGIIGGSGIYDMPGFTLREERAVSTPYGEPSAAYRIGELSGAVVAFLPRHGPGHTIAPHLINYRANIWGFRELGVRRIISVNATGGMDPALSPGDIVLMDQVLDTTQGARAATFYDGGRVMHVDFTDPYCPELRAALLEAGARAGVALRPTGTYVCVNGPRLESRAEIRAFAAMGGHVVGMTGMPEAALAREAELCMASVSVVTNYAAGISERKLTTDEVVQQMAESSGRIKLLLKEAVPLVPSVRACPCKDALKGASA